MKEKMLIELTKKAIRMYGTQNIEVRLEDTFCVYYCNLHEGYPVYKTNITKKDITNIDNFTNKLCELGVDFIE